jgi:hypothetical protein
MSVSLLCPAGAVFAFVVGSSTVFAQPALPTGALHKATVSADNPAEYAFAAKAAGVLNIAVTGEGDLAFAVTDADGQPLPDARWRTSRCRADWGARISSTAFRPV